MGSWLAGCGPAVVGVCACMACMQLFMDSVVKALLVVGHVGSWTWLVPDACRVWLVPAVCPCVAGDAQRRNECLHAAACTSNCIPIAFPDAEASAAHVAAWLHASHDDDRPMNVGRSWCWRCRCAMQLCMPADACLRLQQGSVFTSLELPELKCLNQVFSGQGNFAALLRLLPEAAPVLCVKQCCKLPRLTGVLCVLLSSAVWVVLVRAGCGARTCMYITCCVPCRLA